MSTRVELLVPVPQRSALEDFPSCVCRRSVTCAMVGRSHDELCGKASKAIIHTVFGVVGTSSGAWASGLTWTKISPESGFGREPVPRETNQPLRARVSAMGVAWTCSRLGMQ